jgi:hypothetical protein
VRCADLGRLELLVNEERPGAEEEGQRLWARMNQSAAGDLHGARQPVEAPDVRHVRCADLSDDATLQDVEIFPEQPVTIGRRVSIATNELPVCLGPHHVRRLPQYIGLSPSDGVIGASWVRQPQPRPGEEMVCSPPGA